MACRCPGDQLFLCDDEVPTETSNRGIASAPPISLFQLKLCLPHTRTKYSVGRSSLPRRLIARLIPRLYFAIGDVAVADSDISHTESSHPAPRNLKMPRDLPPTKYSAKHYSA
jgi:hypothetical protein